MSTNAAILQRSNFYYGQQRTEGSNKNAPVAATQPPTKARKIEISHHANLTMVLPRTKGDKKDQTIRSREQPQQQEQQQQAASNSRKREAPAPPPTAATAAFEQNQLNYNSTTSTPHGSHRPTSYYSNHLPSASSSNNNAPRSPRQNWILAAAKVWKGHSSLDKKKTTLMSTTTTEAKSPPDPFGERMTRLLNQTAEFSAFDVANNNAQRPQHNNYKHHFDYNDEDHLAGFMVPPLISRHNVLVLWRWIQGHFLPSKTCSAKPMKQSQQPQWILDGTSWRHVRNATLVFWLSCTVLVVALAHGTVLWSLHVLWFLVVYTFLLLVDWDYIQECFWCRRVEDSGKSTSRTNDVSDLPDKPRSSSCNNPKNGLLSRIFHPHRFQGREWNKQEFLMKSCCSNSSSSATPRSSQTCSLWELPPPSLRLQQKQAKPLQHPQTQSSFQRPEGWSADTAAHVAAIQYCYVMLQEEQRVRQARKLQKEQQKQQKLLQQQSGGNKSGSNPSPGLVQEEITLPLRSFPNAVTTKRQPGTNLLRSPVVVDRVDTTSQRGVRDAHENKENKTTKQGGNLKKKKNTTETPSSTTTTNHNDAILGPILQSLDDYFSLQGNSSSNNINSDSTTTTAVDNAHRANQLMDEMIAEAIEMKVTEDEYYGTTTITTSDEEQQQQYSNQMHGHFPPALAPRAGPSFSFSMVEPDGDDDDDDDGGNRYFRHRTSSSLGSTTLSDEGGSVLSGGGRRRRREDGGAGGEEFSDVDLPWLDVGAKIGMQLLNSAHVHRAVVASAETKERIMESSRELFDSGNNAGNGGHVVSTLARRGPRPQDEHHPDMALTAASHNMRSSQKFFAVSHQTAKTSSSTATHNSNKAMLARNEAIVLACTTMPTPTTTSSSLLLTAKKAPPPQPQQFPHNVLPLLQVVGAGSQQPQPSTTTKLAKPIHPFWTSATAAALKYEPTDDEVESSEVETEEEEENSNEQEQHEQERSESPRSETTTTRATSQLEHQQLSALSSLSRMEKIATSDEEEEGCKSPQSSINTMEADTLSNVECKEDGKGSSVLSGNRSSRKGRDSVSAAKQDRSVHDGVGKKVCHSVVSKKSIQSTLVAAASSADTTMRSVGHLKQGNQRKKATAHHPRSTASAPRQKREPLAPGTKVAVPIFPYQPHTKLQHQQRCCKSTTTGIHSTTTGSGRNRRSAQLPYQMGTVVKSKRIYVKEDESFDDGNTTNCLSVTVQLDKSFLRNGEFAELTFRVMDSWSDNRYMPAHSKAPVGSCVATKFGLGVLVGWRVEDDCHLVRSLWQRRGPGASCAYLNRDAINCVVEASVGFHVQTKFGAGLVLAYVDSGGKHFDNGRFLVSIQEEGRQHHGQVVELYRPDILECPGAQFIPVIEHIREAAHFQIQVDNYQAALRVQQVQRREGNDLDNIFPDTKEDEDDMTSTTMQSFWQTGSAWVEILWNSFLKAVEEEEGDTVDSWLNDLIQGIVVFLERLDEHPPSAAAAYNGSANSNGISMKSDEKKETDDDQCYRSNRQKKPEGNHHRREPSFDTSTVVSGDFAIELVASKDYETSKKNPQKQKNDGTHVLEPGLWLMNDIFGGVFSSKSFKKEEHPPDEVDGPRIEASAVNDGPSDRDVYYNRIFAVLRTLMKTITIARATSVEHPHLRLALAIVNDFFLFCRTFLKVQRRNVSNHSIQIWNRAIQEASSTFGPIQERLEKIGQGIAQRMEKQGRRAKARLLKFADTLLGDERLLFALEQGDWDRCAIRLELALVKSKIIEKENIVYYRKAASFAHRHWKLIISGDAMSTGDTKSGGAAARNNEKLALLAKFVQWIAAPRRSLLKLFERNDVLEVFERILVRVFHKKEEMASSRMLAIHASNFHSLRHLRLLKDFSTSGRRLWMPILDAADEEFAWLVSQLPFGETSKDFMVPLSNLFSLCVAHFHKIERDLTTDWMGFLLDEEAVQIIHDIDTKLILALESFARDVKEMMHVLPYYSSIDDDLLGLMDEVDLDEFLREASEAMEDEEKLNEFIREKATIAIERFLNYLPRMSIPVEKRELMEGWVLTCRGEDGGDLTLSDVKVQRENLVCQILGGDALFFPMFGGSDSNDNGSSSETVAHRSPLSSPSHVASAGTGSNNRSSGGVVEELSVLDHIRDLLLQAQNYGCWRQGVGGVVQPPSDRYVASVLQNLPVSTVLNCGIELWRNLEIDDDELLEIAVRDVSYQIQLQKELEEQEEKRCREGLVSVRSEEGSDVPFTQAGSLASSSQIRSMERKVHEFPTTPATTPFDSKRKRFNPRVDPTVFFLEMRNLSLNLDKFRFRIEKSEHSRTLLDPVFDGKGSLLIQNVSIRLRIECAKERMKRTTTLLGETFIPILVLRELTTSLEKVDLKVKDTGFGSDWLVNKAVEAFADDITKVVAENLREQIVQQVKSAIESLNSYFLMNPNMLLNLLGISMDDLDDQIVWV
ncbi:hypothetical protein ACA910_021439 [Epithemia clementina (nom. ined.)]